MLYHTYLGIFSDMTFQGFPVELIHSVESFEHEPITLPLFLGPLVPVEIRLC